MSWELGGSTADHITITALNINLDGHVFMGWFYPTTLTAGRKYWGSTATTNMQVGPTTSELRVVLDKTTDATWDTTGAGIVVDKWHFICVARASVSGVPAMRCWIGTDDTPPREVTITATTAGSGNIVSSTNLTIGNTSAAGTTSWQGKISQILDYRFTPSAATWLGLETGGVILQAEADQFLNTAVIPAWLGKFPASFGQGTTSCMLFLDLDNPAPVWHVYQRGATIRLGPIDAASSASVTAYSEITQPRPMLAWVRPYRNRR